jgi:hypothetical protein
MNLTMLVSLIIAVLSSASALRAPTKTFTTGRRMNLAQLDLFLDAPLTTMLASQNEATLVSALSHHFYFVEGQEDTATFLDR